MFKNSFLVFLFFLLTISIPPAAQVQSIPDVYEIPYYLRKLKETTLEDKRIEFNKKIHDGIVHADLSDKKVIKKLNPIIDQVRIAMDTNLDRPNLTGKAYWLDSAIRYYEAEKLFPRISIDQSDWTVAQTRSPLSEQSIVTYPDKILISEGRDLHPIIKKSGIHEAVISENGKTVAFFRKEDMGLDKVELWAIKVKNKKAKKVATLPSCLTILLSPNGKKIFFQEKPESPRQESKIGWVSSRGGKIHYIGSASMMKTLVGTGRYKESIILFKKRLHHLGTTKEDCPFAMTAKGKPLGWIQNASCQ